MNNYRASISKIVFFTLFSFASLAQVSKQPKLGYQGVQIIKFQGFEFKDLNKNGKVDNYED